MEQFGARVIRGDAGRLFEESEKDNLKSRLREQKIIQPLERFVLVGIHFFGKAHFRFFQSQPQGRISPWMAGFLSEFSS